MDGLQTVEQTHTSNLANGTQQVKNEQEKVTGKKLDRNDKLRKDTEKSQDDQKQDEHLKDILKKFDQSPRSASIRFNIEREDGRTIIEIQDKSSGEILRKIPNEETLRIAQNIEDFLESHNEKGLAIDNKA